MTQGWHACLDLARRYRAALQTAWEERQSMRSPARTPQELAFLPPHLALIETPASPLPHWSMRSIAALVCLALAWACLGKFDIVAVAAGKVISNGRTKIIQPAEKAVVSAILVHDGQQVHRGQLLVELEAIGADADNRQAKEALNSAQLNAARYQALLTALQGTQSPRLQLPNHIDPQRGTAEQTLMLGQWSAYQARQAALYAALRQRDAETRSTQQRIKTLRQTLHITEQREHDFQNLLKRNFVSHHAYLDKQQQRVEQQTLLATQHSRLLEIQAAHAQQSQELHAHRAEFTREALEQLRQATLQISQYQEENRKTALRQQHTRLISPVNGSVQQLAIHTIGGVVSEAQALMAIVPDNQIMEVEAKVENKDIGFIRPGQSVVVKIESFPYTRYGVLEGIVSSVSHDAMHDEKLGAVFQTRIQLKSNRLIIDRRPVNLTAGMQVQVEIKTGQRRVISYFLSPLQQVTNESLRER
jgi:hemolysin D